MKKSMLAGAAIAVALTLAGCGDTDAVTEAAETTSVAVPTEAAPLEGLETKTAEPTPEPEPTPESEAPSAGSRDNPGNPDTDVATFAETWEVQIGRFDPDARPEIMAENQFNDAPAEGNTYIMLPVTATYIGPDSGEPWLDLDITFVTRDGRSFEQVYAVIPNDLSDVAPLYNGGVGEGNIAFEVPADALEGATFAVSYAWGDPLFFAAIPQG